jgi:O-antigen/teichoic acid export membrane protein
MRRLGAGSRIVREVAWVAGGQVMSAIAAVAAIRIMTELLSPDEFGRLTLLLGAAGLALGLAANPWLQAAIRYYPVAAEAQRIGALRTRTIHLVTPGVLVAATLLVLAPLAAGPWFGGTWYTGLLVATLLVVDCIRSLEVSLFNSARRQREAALVYAADAWSRPLTAIATVVAFGSSADTALAGYVAGSAAVVLAMRLCMRMEGSGERHAREDAGSGNDAELGRWMKDYAWPLLPLAVFGWLGGMGDRYVVAGLLGLQEAGLYAAAYGLASRPFLMLGAVVELTMRPVLQDAVAARNAAMVARAKATWLLVTVAGAGLGVLAFVLLSGWVGELLLAAQYRTATALMPWIALGYALYNVATVYTRFCYAFDDTRAVSLLVVFGTLIGFAATVPAIMLWGLIGAALSVPIGFAAQLLLAFVLARRAEANLRRKEADVRGRVPDEAR